MGALSSWASARIGTFWAIVRVTQAESLWATPTMSTRSPGFRKPPTPTTSSMAMVTARLPGGMRCHSAGLAPMAARWLESTGWPLGIGTSVMRPARASAVAKAPSGRCATCTTASVSGPSGWDSATLAAATTIGSVTTGTGTSGRVFM
ncbi:hypothetical protein D3C72_1036130 [compost metagenome]